MESLYKLDEPLTTTVAKKQGIVPVSLFSSTITRWLLGTTFLLLVGNIAAMILKHTSANQTKLFWYFNKFFNFNYEGNFPSFFSSVLLIGAAGLLLLLYTVAKQQGNKYAKSRWFLLSLVFMFLAIDENTQIHEVVADYVRPKLASDLSGLLYWAWVVPYFMAFIVIVAYFLPFVIRLPKKMRSLIILAGFMFVFGAVGLELAEGYFYKKYGFDHIYNDLLYCVEELLEMTGVIVFINALMNYMASMNTPLMLKREANAVA